MPLRKTVTSAVPPICLVARRKSKALGSSTALPVDVEDDVAGLETGRLRRAAGRQIGDQRAARHVELEVVGEIGVERLQARAEPGTHHLPAAFGRLGDEGAMLAGMAKPMPTEPPDCEKMAVLMPTSRPCRSTSAPPELPGLMAASVWMKNE